MARQRKGMQSYQSTPSEGLAGTARDSTWDLGEVGGLAETLLSRWLQKCHEKGNRWYARFGADVRSCGGTTDLSPDLA